MPFPPLKPIHPTVERDRKHQQVLGLACLQGDIRRATGGDHFEGALGDLVEQSIMDRYDPGDEDSSGRGGTKHASIINAANPWYIHAQRVCDALFFVRSKNMQIRAPFVASPAWAPYRRDSGMDEALQIQLPWSQSMGSSYVGVTLHHGAAPTVSAVQPFVLTVRGTQSHPQKPAVIVRDHFTPRRGKAQNVVDSPDYVTVWDVSDPARPYWGRWSRRDAWEEWRKNGGPQRTLSGGDFHYEGAAYPLRYRGMPILPGSCYPSKRGQEDLLPMDPALTQDTVNLITKAAWAEYVLHTGSFPRTVITSQKKVSGLEQADLNPSQMLNVHGGGDGQIGITEIDAAVEGGMKLFEAFNNACDAAAKRYDQSLEAVVVKEAQSGVALRVRNSKEFRTMERQETLVRDRDIALLCSMIAAYNASVAYGWISGPYLPEPPVDEIEVFYPRVWSEDERQAQREWFLKLIEKNLASPVDLELYDRDLDDDPEIREEVMERLLVKADENARLRAAGFMPAINGTPGVSVSVQQPAATAEPPVTHTPPADVATMATRGLNMKRRYPGRATDLEGISTGAKELRERARRLRDQQPFTTGQLRELNDWLDSYSSHKDDDNRDVDGNVLPGVWDPGEGEEPSGRWITWCSQSGNPGQVWTEGKLVEPVTATATPSGEQA